MFILVIDLLSCLYPLNEKKSANLQLQTTISDLVQISPEDFQKPSAESIEDNINAKYANKVFSICSERNQQADVSSR